MNTPETVMVSSPAVACDGGEGALGHPRVYLKINASGSVTCPYCDKQFVLANAPVRESHS